jgi:glycosyl transferase family 25
MNIPVFLINLDKHKCKYEKSSNTLENVGFTNIQRIPAVDGSKLKNYSKITTLHTQFLLNEPYYRCSHQQLNTLGAIGCYLSHVKCWREVIKKGYSGAFIFEDDLELVPNFSEKIIKIMENVPQDCDLLSFGYIKLLEQHKFKNPIELSKATYIGAQGYYITKQGAEKLLQYVFPIEMHVDGYISLMNYFNYINVYFTDNTLVNQNNINGTSINYIDCYKCYLPNTRWNFARPILVFIFILVILLILFFVKIKWIN